MAQDYPAPIEVHILGFDVLVDNRLGHLAVTHDGTITWDKLQEIKNKVWGQNSRAIEVYPVQSDVVNNAPMRHLWRLGADDFCPDMLGHIPPKQTLEQRYQDVWSAANE
jgi:hypothetical protein